MRVVFLGTEDIGEIALRRLAESSHKVVLVVTQPDRPKGRGRKIVPGNVKVTAEELGIPFIQPETVRRAEARDAILGSSPDIIAVVSYGEYIPASIFDAPPHKSINVHPSLLPRWRGASPVRHALIAGDDMTGVTVQYIHKRMDAGDILLQEEIAIEPDDDHGSLCGRLYPLGAELLVQALDGLEAGTIRPVPQDESKVTKAPKIEKDDLRLDWARPALDVRNRIRAFSPTPGARAVFRDSDYKILAADREFRQTEGQPDPGRVADISDLGPIVACGDAALVITRLQPPGKNPLSGRDFLNGYRVEVGERFAGRSEGGSLGNGG